MNIGWKKANEKKAPSMKDVAVVAVVMAAGLYSLFFVA